MLELPDYFFKDVSLEISLGYDFKHDIIKFRRRQKPRKENGKEDQLPIMDESLSRLNNTTNRTAVWEEVVNANDEFEITVSRQIENSFSFDAQYSSNAGKLSPDFLALGLEGFPPMVKGIAFQASKGDQSPWTVPVRFSSFHELKGCPSINFIYIETGLPSCPYATFTPLSGNGYQGTLSFRSGIGFGIQTITGMSGGGIISGRIPLILISLGRNLQKLIDESLRIANIIMDNPKVKVNPLQDPYTSLGWCTWNSSEQGEILTEGFIFDNIERFQEKGVNVRWLMVDDGWMTSSTRSTKVLDSFEPCKERFPNGFKLLNNKLKEMGIKNIGIWITINGYWNGISPKHFPEYNCYEYQKNRYFVVPQDQERFYRDWMTALKDNGFTFCKVDNQIVCKSLASWKYPMQSFSFDIHSKLNKVSKEVFSSSLINCMCLTPENYNNFVGNVICRASEDYFPHGDSYCFQGHSNAFSHIMQAVYNSLYLSSCAITDFDMFESTNTHAEFHAICRSLHNGPIYITDKAYSVLPHILDGLVSKDGKVLMADTSLKPSKDCLFQLQDPLPFKMSSRTFVNNSVGMVVVNMSDCERVEGLITWDEDIELDQGKYAIYDWFKGTLNIWEGTSSDSIPLKIILGKGEFNLYHVIPFINGLAPIGLIGTYNSSAGIHSLTWKGPNQLDVILHESGKFGLGLLDIKMVEGMKVNIDGGEDIFLKSSHPRVENRGTFFIINSVDIFEGGGEGKGLHLSFSMLTKTKAT